MTRMSAKTKDQLIDTAIRQATRLAVLDGKSYPAGDKAAKEKIHADESKARATLRKTLGQLDDSQVRKLAAAQLLGGYGKGKNPAAAARVANEMALAELKTRQSTKEVAPSKPEPAEEPAAKEPADESSSSSSWVSTTPSLSGLVQEVTDKQAAYLQRVAMGSRLEEAKSDLNEARVERQNIELKLQSAEHPDAGSRKFWQGEVKEQKESLAELKALPAKERNRAAVKRSIGSIQGRIAQGERTLEDMDAGESQKAQWRAGIDKLEHSEKVLGVARDSAKLDLDEARRIEHEVKAGDKPSATADLDTVISDYKQANTPSPSSTQSRKKAVAEGGAAPAQRASTRSRRGRGTREATACRR